jgi:hypothetical protein
MKAILFFNNGFNSCEPKAVNISNGDIAILLINNNIIHSIGEITTGTLSIKDKFLYLDNKVLCYIPHKCKYRLNYEYFFSITHKNGTISYIK